MAEEEISLDELLLCLLESSEKAVRIAQVFRENNDLFQLLVEKKSVLVRNKQFVQDFKTLADVLVQETIKKDVADKFPTILSKIQGEEQNTFQNTLGESIKVELSSVCQTVELLCKVFNGNLQVAEILADIVHGETQAVEFQCSTGLSIAAERIGIWIDPIDSTAEYIQAKEDVIDDCGILQYGLKCVCVLIGAYDLQTGKPIIGIVNQPFYKKDENLGKWQNKICWGISYNNESAISHVFKTSERLEKIIVTSSSESETLQNIMKTKFKVVHVAGAGYKCLLAACKKADMYVLSQGTVHFWDTCGPHAILAAAGGGILNFQEVVQSKGIQTTDDLKNCQIKYFPVENDIALARNRGGVIAYRNPYDVIDFLSLLKDHNYNFNPENS